MITQGYQNEDRLQSWLKSCNIHDGFTKLSLMQLSYTLFFNKECIQNLGKQQI